MCPSILALSRRSARRLHAEEEGMLSLASLFVVMGFLLLIGLLFNAGVTTARKLETQNAADAAANSTAVELARGMNAITAANHLMGELTALVVLMHTFAGDTPDGGKTRSTPPGLKAQLASSYYKAKGLAQRTPVPVLDQAYNEASKDSQVDGAIFDARMRLNLVLSWAYQAHGFFGLITEIIQNIPLVNVLTPAPASLELAAWFFEAKVYEECLVLDALEYFATTVLQPIKVALRDGVIPGLHTYSWLIATIDTPYYASRAASSVGPPNRADCSVYPRFLSLPVHQEPPQLNNPAKSQLVRASTPWIQWWRGPWLDFGKQFLILSRFADAYVQNSNKYTLPIIQNLKQKNGVNLYILNGMDSDGSGKTFESWTRESEEAEQMFTLVGLAHRSAPGLASSGIFRFQGNPDGIACYAQAMFYNANPQVRGSGDGTWQPTAGWDTLNWDTWSQPLNRQVAPEFPGPMPQVNGTDTPTATPPQPLIRLNWQAKLVPTTRLGEATLGQIPGTPLSNLLRQTDSSLSLSRTH